MPTIDGFSFLNGACATLYFVACLTCGLQLCFDIFRNRSITNLLFSRIMGGTFLLLAIGAICYIFSYIFGGNHLFMLVGNIIDSFVLVSLALLGYVLYSNNRPSTGVLISLVSLYIIYTLAYLLVPSVRGYLPDIVTVIFILLFLFFGFRIHRQEKSWENLYSNPERHSRSWIFGIIGFLFGWLALRYVFFLLDLKEWYDVALYLYMTGMISFVYVKSANYGLPVSVETQEQVEVVESGTIDITPDISNPLQKSLTELLEKDEIYLNPDLTVDDVVKLLGTNTKYFSSMLRNDMHITFCSLINRYRVEKAKDVLKSTDEKIASVAHLCGFNSTESFCRTFSKMSGTTPTRWRNK